MAGRRREPAVRGSGRHGVGGLDGLRGPLDEHPARGQVQLKLALGRSRPNAIAMLFQTLSAKLGEIPEMISRRNFVTLTAAVAASSQASAATGGNDVFHVAIFRFAKEHINDAMAAFRALASASRQESGNLRYDIYRGIDDDQVFYVAEHWASREALAAHEHTEAFIHFGQDVLVRHAMLHDTVTARAFE